MGVRDWRALGAALLALLAIAGALANALSQRAPRRSGTNGVWVRAEGAVPAGVPACQRRELLPADTVALLIPGQARGPATLTLSRRGRLLQRVAAVGNPRHEDIEARIRRTARDQAGVKVCVTFRKAAVLYEGPTPPTVGSLTIGPGFTAASMAITYMLPGQRTWWAHASTVAARMGRGRGDWTSGRAVWLIGALLAASLLLAGWTVWRGIVANRPVPRLAWIVMAIAACNAATWSLITPAFQVPDEVAHVAYVQRIGETGGPPTEPRSIYVSSEQATAMADAGYGSMDAPTLNSAVWARARQQRLLADLHLPLSRAATTYMAEGEPEPPLYYTLEALPYRLAHGATLLDRMALMRLLSALMGGITALLCVLFLRECLPSRPWAWAVGGLAVAFMPMLGFISGGVNPDALLLPLAAALFCCLARAWRRGVTLRLALGLGALVAAGLLTKVNFYGLVPGAFLGLLLAARRGAGSWNRRVAILAGAVLGVAAAVFLAGTAFQVLVWHRPFTVGRPAAPESHVGILSHLSYVWQVFLPRLPFQRDVFPGHPAYVRLFETFVGAFGWLTVWLPLWGYQLAAGALGLIAMLAGRTLAASPRELRWRRGEALGYVAMAGVLMVLIGLSADLRRDLIHIVQGRYLLPLLPLFGLLLALGARGAGERWGRAVGVAIVALAVAGTLFGQLVTVSFFYS